MAVNRLYPSFYACLPFLLFPYVTIPVPIVPVTPVADPDVYPGSDFSHP